MGALRAMVSASLLAVITPAHATNPVEHDVGTERGEIDPWQATIAEASTRFAIPVIWIERVIHAESAGHVSQNGRPIRSRAGAMGLMQLMPRTWAEMRQALGLGPNPDDPHDNIMAGTYYLRLMFERFGYPGLFGAYNAGPARYADHLATGQSLPPETLAYLAKLSGQAIASETALHPTNIEPPPGLFVVRKAIAVADSATLSNDGMTSLFAVRK